MADSSGRSARLNHVRCAGLSFPVIGNQDTLIEAGIRRILHGRRTTATYMRRRIEVSTLQRSRMPIPAIGSKAPDFDLPGSKGENFALRNYAGKMLVLFFYPKDDTSGCTSESVAFTQLKEEFGKLGAALLGVSPDSPASHDKFIKKHALDVDLASSEDKAMLEAYGVWQEKSMYGKKYMGVERTTLLIDGAGVVKAVWNKVKVPGHADEVLAAVKAA
jgi:peroxiredoxin Q/BCP